MQEKQQVRPAQVIGPEGETLTLKDLPPADLGRWSVKRKAEVVAAVAGGLLTIEEACEIYSLSLEEFTRWQSTLERSGLRGLRATKAQRAGSSSNDRLNRVRRQQRSDQASVADGHCHARISHMPWRFVAGTPDRAERRPLKITDDDETVSHAMDCQRGADRVLSSVLV